MIKISKVHIIKVKISYSMDLNNKEFTGVKVKKLSSQVRNVMNSIIII